MTLGATRLLTPERSRIVLQMMPVAAGFALLVTYVRLVHASHAHGLMLENDFACFWLAAKAVVLGDPALAYDNQAFFAFGGNFFEENGTLQFMYPPTFLMLIAPLGVLPNVAAFLVFMGLSLAAYLAVGRALWGNWTGALVLAALPASVVVVYFGQGTFLLGALSGGGLVALKSGRPVLAGVLFGLLTIKPQLGLLIPFALLAGRYWSAFAAAALTALMLVVSSWLVLGADVWAAFLEQTAFSGGLLSKAQLPGYLHVSPYTGVLQIGLPNGAALAVQSVLSLALLALVVRLWRQPAAFDLKAALLSAAALLSTPYLLTYDLALTGIPLLFLVHHCGRNGFVPGDKALIAVAVLVSALANPVSYHAGLPIGPVAPVILLGLSLRHAARMRISETNTGTANPATV